MGDFRFGDVDTFVHVPILLAGNKRVVRLGKGHMKHEGAVIGRTRVVVEFLFGGAKDFFVVVDLQVPLTVASFDNAQKAHD